jgi:hypothetical protein
MINFEILVLTLIIMSLVLLYDIRRNLVEVGLHNAYDALIKSFEGGAYPPPEEWQAYQVALFKINKLKPSEKEKYKQTIKDQTKRLKELSGA